MEKVSRGMPAAAAAMAAEKWRGERGPLPGDMEGEGKEEGEMMPEVEEEEARRRRTSANTFICRAGGKEREKGGRRAGAERGEKTDVEQQDGETMWIERAGMCPKQPSPQGLPSHGMHTIRPRQLMQRDGSTTTFPFSSMDAETGTGCCVCANPSR